MLAFFTIITIVQFNDIPDAPLAFPFSVLSVMYILPVILLAAGPVKTVNRRLIFLALGLLLLIALNELSKLGLDVTAPKLQG